jgi:hypothetical protein
VDKGSETGEMWAFQKAFRYGMALVLGFIANSVYREIYAPSIDSTIIAPWRALKSTDNTPIETVWQWLQKFMTMNVYNEVMHAYVDVNVNATDPTHLYVT